MTLTARLTLVLSVVLAVAFALLTLAHYRALHQAVLDASDATLMLRSRDLAQRGELPYDPEVFYQVVDGQGRVLKASPGLESVPLPSQPLSRPFSTELRGLPMRLLVVPHGTGLLKLGESLHLANAGVGGSVGGLMLTSLACLALVLASTWLVLQQGLQPLRRVTEVAADILDTNDFSRRLAVNHPTKDVISSVAKEVNRLLARVDGLLESQRRLLADTSHELRNPLMVMRTDVELLARELDPAMRAEVSSEILAEVDRMTRLVENLLTLSWADQKLPLRNEPVRLDVLAQELVARCRRAHPDRRLEFRGEPLYVEGDRERLLQMATNLVDNALRYTEGAVFVTVRPELGQAVLEVRDEGSGIPPEYHITIFDRFVRLHEDKSGSGLGLPIVKGLAEAHGGSVEVVNAAPEGGAIFRIRVPASSP